MDQETRDKVNKLPAWAKTIIVKLEQEAEQNKREIKRLQQMLDQSELRYKKLKGKVDAMEVILTCAARGGHETAQAYVDRIVSEYKHEDVE